MAAAAAAGRGSCSTPIDNQSGSPRTSVAVATGHDLEGFNVVGGVGIHHAHCRTLPLQVVLSEL